MRITAIMAPLLIAATVAAGPVGRAQAAPIQNGHDVQPTQGQVTQQERAAGVAPPSNVAQGQTAVVEQQANHLIAKSRAQTRDLPGSTEAR